MFTPPEKVRRTASSDADDDVPTATTTRSPVTLLDHRRGCPKTLGGDGGGGGAWGCGAEFNDTVFEVLGSSTTEVLGETMSLNSGGGVGGGHGRNGESIIGVMGDSGGVQRCRSLQARRY